MQFEFPDGVSVSGAGGRELLFRLKGDRVKIGGNATLVASGTLCGVESEKIVRTRTIF